MKSSTYDDSSGMPAEAKKALCGNVSAKTSRLVRELEAMGHRNVRVWWERLGMAMEMCGPSGGWFCESDMTHYQPEPLGLNFDAALSAIRNHSWLDFRHVPRTPNTN